ncbi:MAG: hypothetical protein IIA77_07975 [Proteobacteria bacterium]|nr:hypothetical protein [Pseudomonadota bacterium]
MNLNSAGNTEVSAYLALKEMGYDVSKNKWHRFVKLIRIPTHNEAINDRQQSWLDLTSFGPLLWH